MLHLIVDCIKSSSLHFYNEISNVSLRSRSSLECCPEIDWGLRAAMKVLMKIKSPNVWHGGGMPSGCSLHFIIKMFPRSFLLGLNQE